MLSNLRLSAIAVGLLILVFMSVLTFFIGTTSLAWAVSIENRALTLAFVLMIFTAHLCSYLAAGYCAATLAGTQPLLHGAICGFAGLGVSMIFGDNLLMAFMFDVPAAVTGAWLRKRRAYG